MTEAARPGQASRAEAAKHVGVIGHGPALTQAQRAVLGQALINITRKHGKNLILHHGCRPGSDEAAHRIVRNIGGWRIHGHPDTDGLPQPAQRILDDVDVPSTAYPKRPGR